MKTNTFVRDMDLEGVDVFDGRKFEIVSDGLTLLFGAQLDIDTTLVSLLHRDGTARRTAADNNGAALKQANRLKGTPFQELSEERGRARLVSLAAEVGERLSEKTAQSFRALAKAHAQTAPLIPQKSVKAAWLRRWCNILASSAAKAFAWYFLNKHPSPGTAAEVPQMHEVLEG